MIETWTELWPVTVPQHLDLRILAYARWPETEDDTLTPIAGFVVSSFNPLVAEVADRCLSRRAANSTAPEGPESTAFDNTVLDNNVPDSSTAQAPTSTAILLVSVGGDRATARAIADAVRTGRRVPPLLFFQSNPNAVLGHIAARRRLTGPVVSISPRRNEQYSANQYSANPRTAIADGIPADAFTEADWLLRDGDADEVLLIAAEQGDGPGDPDRAEAALVTRRP
jgi:hypothetical protein